MRAFAGNVATVAVKWGSGVVACSRGVVVVGGMALPEDSLWSTTIDDIHLEEHHRLTSIQ
jgi:hypothetical protein